jgi:hypothetical protein
MSDATTTKQILLTRRSAAAYWRVRFNHPPLNIFGPDTIPKLNEIITALETDERATMQMEVCLNANKPAARSFGSGERKTYAPGFFRA